MSVKVHVRDMLHKFLVLHFSLVTRYILSDIDTVNESKYGLPADTALFIFITF